MVRQPVARRGATTAAPPVALNSTTSRGPATKTGANDGAGGSAVWVLVQMVMIAAGIYTCFFAWGIMHEKVATHSYIVDGKPAKFKYHLVTCLIGACCTITTSLVGMILLAIIGRPVKRISLPFGQLAFVGLTMTFSAPLGLTAAKHLSYPVYLTVKMCKMVPTVIVGMLWHRARYSLAKLLATLFITVGVLGFSLLSERDDSKAATNSPSSDDTVWSSQTATTVTAVIMCFVAMTLDGYTNSTQDAINTKYRGLHPLQMMLGLSMSVVMWCILTLIGAEYVLPETLYTEVVKPELFHAAAFVTQSPTALYDLVLLGFLNAGGQIFIYTGLGIFGSLTVMAIGTTRKIGSVFISIAVHGHQVAMGQWAALGSVVLGVVFEAYDAVHSKKKKAH